MEHTVEKGSIQRLDCSYWCCFVVISVAFTLGFLTAGMQPGSSDLILALYRVTRAETKIQFGHLGWETRTRLHLLLIIPGLLQKCHMDTMELYVSIYTLTTLRH